MVVVGYTRLNSENIAEIVVHQEYDSKQEAIEGAEALALASINDETILDVIRGTRYNDTEIVYNVVHEIPRDNS
jgi:hypothetical protein